MPGTSQRLIRKLTGLAFLGAAIGTLLAFTAPPARAEAAKTCVCNDHSSGNYACLLDQSACGTGSEWCRTTCQ